MFAVDVLHCPRCGDRRRVIAFVTAPDAIDRILAHLCLAASSRPPPAPVTTELILDERLDAP